MADEVTPQSTEDVITSSLNEQFGDDWNTDAAPDTEIIEVGSDNDTGDDDTGESDTKHPADGDDAGDTDAVDADAEGEVAEEKKKPVKEEKDKDDTDDTDKELAALGVKADNRMPYSRVKKTFENAKKKWNEGVQATIKTHTDKIAAHEESIGRYKATDALIQNDPDRFMRVLAHLNPNYQRFVDFIDGKGKTAETKTETSYVADPNDKRPEPDFTYQDGSKGYTPEGFDKVMSWNARQAVREAVTAARKEWEKDFGPIRQEREEQRKFKEAEDARRASVQDQVSRTRKVWGDEVLTKHKDAILAKLNEDKTLNFGDAVAAVMYPLLSKNRDTIHADVVAELNKRPGAVSKTGGKGTTKETTKDVNDMTTEEVILQSLREQGLVR